MFKPCSAVVFSALCLAGCAGPRIGVLSARELAQSGRPHEAILALTHEEEVGEELALDTATLLHEAGQFAQSEQAFASTSPAVLHAAERTSFDRMRALNQLVVSQSVDALPAGWPRPHLASPGTARVVVIFEQGWAPRVRRVSQPAPAPQSAPPGKTASNGSKAPAPAPAPEQPPDTFELVDPGSRLAEHLRLDDAAPVASIELEDLTGIWGSHSLDRALNQNQPILLNPFDFEAQAAAQRRQRFIWWSPPTRFSMAEVGATPGKHVLMISTLTGPRELLIDLAAGQTLYLVTRR